MRLAVGGTLAAPPPSYHPGELVDLVNSNPVNPPDDEGERTTHVRLLVSSAGEVVGLSGDSTLISDRELWGCRIADLFDDADGFVRQLGDTQRDEVRANLRTSEEGRLLYARGNHLRGQFSIEFCASSAPKGADRAHAGELTSQTEPAEALLSRTPPRSRAGLRAVLCVDDEEMILRVYRRMFPAPTKVLVARSVAEALAILDVNEEIDAVLCDVMMPEASGYELLQHLTNTRSRLMNRFGFISGGVISLKLEASIRQSGAPLCSKPFNGRDLDVLIERIFERDAAMPD